MNTSRSSAGRVTFDSLISYDTAKYICLVYYVYLGPMVAAFGIAFNIINIIVYVSQGFRDSVNISFTTLACSDIGGLLSALWYGIGLNPDFVRLVNYAYSPSEFMNFTAAWPRAYFSKITCWITVFITLERCMCIVAPLKVKTLLTPKRTAVCMLVLYCLGVIITFPHAYLNAVFLVWKFDFVSNRTFLGFGYGPNYHNIDLIGGFINTMSIIIPLGVLIISTGLIIVELQRKSLWRQSVANSGGAMDAAFMKRDRVVFKVISVLAFLLIICYLPHACNFTAYAIVPDFSLT
ncbi:G-protein coupled receptor, partial [Biomphalaria pfeifferi]